MRILVSTAVGALIGALFLVNLLGWVPWCPSKVLMVLHYPTMLLAGALFSGESGFWDSLPFVTLQWPVIGALVGLVLHLKRKSANSAVQRAPDSASVSNSSISGPAPPS